ncbi:hypothetical protein D9756_009700 [Leucocoprinus leucothites]|uniref:Uncharacterized protein n=1 Tax=Leucocoprinus leucothites TaxID=201217 RepID=A0A8H5FTK1_9AGAR|nr:hypothetical protein D9756_009700 [Leucoagaricus leucothites]
MTIAYQSSTMAAALEYPTLPRARGPCTPIPPSANAATSTPATAVQAHNITMPTITARTVRAAYDTATILSTTTTTAAP